MRHITNLPGLEERAQMLQSNFLVRATSLPNDILFSTLISKMNTRPSTSHQHKLQQGKLWRQVQETVTNPASKDKNNCKTIPY